MRLAGQAKAGFYPAPAEAVEMVARCLQPPAKGRFCILDPCCGLGDAIVQLAEALDCLMRDVYAVELDELRGETVKRRLADELGCQVLAPASFYGTGISRQAFSFIWCNPPFDDELGGGKRVELSFVQRSTHLLVPDGVIALVCPEHVAQNNDVAAFLQSWYTDIRMVEFPADHRPFDEVVVFGVKRPSQVPAGNQRRNGAELRSSAGPDFKYRLPRSSGPKRFERTDMTQSEIMAALTRSPLRRHLETAVSMPLPSPPLSLGNGHRALLLAAGQLDGRVCPPGEPPHVVRGTAAKRSYVQSVETDERKDGEYTKTVIVEKIVLVVRVATASGEILTLSQDGEAAADAASEGAGSKRKAA